MCIHRAINVEWMVHSFVHQILQSSTQYIAYCHVRTINYLAALSYLWTRVKKQRLFTVAHHPIRSQNIEWDNEKINNQVALKWALSTDWVVSTETKQGVENPTIWIWPLTNSKLFEFLHCSSPNHIILAPYRIHQTNANTNLKPFKSLS